MITRIKIDGFKSFHHFEMTFTPFTVIAGVNASGKSNLFDALMLLARLAETDLKTAFTWHGQRGNPNELFTQYGGNHCASELTFEVDMLLNREIHDNWGGKEQLNHTRLRYRLIIEKKQNQFNIDDLFIKHESLEKIRPDEDDWVKKILPESSKSLVKSERSGGTAQPYIRTEAEGNTVAIKIRQDGKQGGKATRANAASQTVLSAINSVDFKHVLAAKAEMISWRFLQFNPEDLGEPSKKEMGLQNTLSRSGKYLAATLFRIGQDNAYRMVEISRMVQSFLPQFTEVVVRDDEANNQYLVKLRDKDKNEYTSRVLSEGTLRILALCVLANDDQHTGLLCFEEPENGIHPFKIKDMARLLKELSTDFLATDLPLRQIIVNTHSPGLVGEIYHWTNDPSVSIWYAKMKNQISDITGKRVKLSVTGILPVLKDRNGPLLEIPVPYSEPELKLTLSTVKQYLETDHGAS